MHPVHCVHYRGKMSSIVTEEDTARPKSKSYPNSKRVMASGDADTQRMIMGCRRLMAVYTLGAGE